MGEQVTVKDVVMKTIKTLEEIRVPMSMMQEIGFPISGAISNLKACCEAWDRDEAEKAEDGDDDA